MPIEIDQSGKVEDTRKLTVICFANGKAKTLLISAKEKRKVLIIMREIDRPHKNFVFRIFSGLIFLLIKNEKIDSLVIDREYQRKPDVIVKASDVLDIFILNKRKPRH